MTALAAISSGLARADALIRELGRPRLAGLIERDWRPLLLLIVVFGPIYGAFMGSFDLTPERSLLMLYGGIKVPILILLTTVICLPGFFALNTVLGLRDDFGRAMRAILAGQAALAVTLASLAPLTRFAYTSGVDHRWALIFNAAMFTLATGIGQLVMMRRYRALIAQRPAHRLMLWTWVILYAFVGIQTGWMLRPFVGSPGLPVAFFRPEPFSNAYDALFRIFLRL
ncbi:MAG: hypothetical protein WD749_06815 [Phycisphaerales bacterium]